MYWSKWGINYMEDTMSVCCFFYRAAAVWVQKKGSTAEWTLYYLSSQAVAQCKGTARSIKLSHSLCASSCSVLCFASTAKLGAKGLCTSIVSNLLNDTSSNFITCHYSFIRIKGQVGNLHKLYTLWICVNEQSQCKTLKVHFVTPGHQSIR